MPDRRKHLGPLRSGFRVKGASLRPRIVALEPGVSDGGTAGKLRRLQRIIPTASILIGVCDHNSRVGFPPDNNKAVNASIGLDIYGVNNMIGIGSSDAGGAKRYSVSNRIILIEVTT